jgi:hypothetical protein
MTDEAKEVPGPDADELVAELDAIRAKNKQLLDEAKAAKRELRKYADLDPDEYRKLQEAHEAAEAERAKAAGDWEKLQTKYEGKLAERDSIIASQDTRFRETRKKAEAALAIAKHDGNPTLLLNNVLGALQTDDEYNVYVELEDGKHVSVEDYVGSLKGLDEWAGAFAPVGIGGSGSRPSTPSGSSFEFPENIEFIG